MAKNTVTFSQAQVEAIVAQAVAQALASVSAGKVDKAPTSKKSTRKTKADKAPKTFTEAVGTKAERTKFVKDTRKANMPEAKKALKAKGVKFTVGEYGNITFAPLKDQPEGLFKSRKEFTKYREDFRKQYKYC